MSRSLVAIVLMLVVVAAVGELLRRSAGPPRAPFHAPQPEHPIPMRAAAPCDRPAAFAAAASENGLSLSSAQWSVFGRPESGWRVYAPLAGREIGAGCPPQSEGFAAALAAWQASRRLPATGVMDEPTLRALDLVWLGRRPFVAASAGGACPAPPPPERLAWADASEGYGGKPVQLRAGALAAYRRMVAAARDESATVAADRRLLTIFSGYRDPAGDAARCAMDGNCGTAARANCSAHRTGLAMDLYLGAAPGFRPESSADENRLYQSQSPAYRWLVANGARFGFVNYPFEPWHWEWTGEPP